MLDTVLRDERITLTPSAREQLQDIHYALTTTLNGLVQKFFTFTTEQYKLHGILTAKVLIPLRGQAFYPELQELVDMACKSSKNCITLSEYICLQIAKSAKELCLIQELWTREIDSTYLTVGLYRDRALMTFLWRLGIIVKPRVVQEAILSTHLLSQLHALEKVLEEIGCRMKKAAILTLASYLTQTAKNKALIGHTANLVKTNESNSSE